MVKTFTLFADKDTLRLDVAENGWAKLTLMGQNGGAGGRTQCLLHSCPAPPLLGAGGDFGIVFIQSLRPDGPIRNSHLCEGRQLPFKRPGFPIRVLFG